MRSRGYDYQRQRHWIPDQVGDDRRGTWEGQRRKSGKDRGGRGKDRGGKAGRTEEDRQEGQRRKGRKDRGEVSLAIFMSGERKAGMA